MVRSRGSRAADDGAVVLKGAIIGFGEVAANGHWPAYQGNDDVAIVAVIDRSAERRQLAARTVPGAMTFATLRDFFDCPLPAVQAIDFIDICTPPALHAEPVLAAVARGWHVLCEKPFLLDPVIVDEVRRQALSRNVAVIPVHNWKYAPIVRRATDVVQSGAIGALRRVEIEVTRLRAAPTAEADRPNWRRDPALAGGGILMDHGWHAVYLALHWIGQRSTGTDAVLHFPAAHVVEDEATVTVKFPAAEAAISLTWNGNVRRNVMRLTGDEGQIVVADDVLEMSGRRQERVRFPQALSAGSHHSEWFSAMLSDVVRGFRSPEASRAVFEEAAECLTIIRRAYESALNNARHH